MTGKDGKAVKLEVPHGNELPPKGFARAGTGCHTATFKTKVIKIDPSYDRLRLLDPFPA